MADQNAKLNYLLKLGDSSLIMGHRLSEWTGHGPVLEHDIALTNIALDHLGQARMLLTHAGEIEGKGRAEDDFAYWRNAGEFRNHLLCELPNADFAQTVLKMFLFDAYQLHLHRALSASPDDGLKAIAVKSLKETTYHLRYSSDWMMRLGDGTEESKRRMTEAIDNVWPYFGDLFARSEGEEILEKAGVVPAVEDLKAETENLVREVFNKSALPAPDFDAVMQQGSQTGYHTEYLSFILSEMQSVTRAHPGATW